MPGTDRQSQKTDLIIAKPVNHNGARPDVIPHHYGIEFAGDRHKRYHYGVYTPFYGQKPLLDLASVAAYFR